MTEHTAQEALAAWLISTTTRPVCKTLACPGCELPHLRTELEAILKDHSPEAIATAALDLLRGCRSNSTPDAASLRRGLIAVGILTPDALPRPALAFLQLKELAARERQLSGNTNALAMHLLRILPCWPEVCDRVARGEIPHRNIPLALVEHMKEQAAVVMNKEEVPA
jgi:hypothetical protein